MATKDNQAHLLLSDVNSTLTPSDSQSQNVKVMQLKDMGADMATKLSKDPIPQSERTFLHWKNINYFVPSKSDPNILPK